jgi:hypothetical protein
MIKEQIATLLERDYLIPDLKKNINKLLEYSDEQLYSLLENGLTISDNLILQYYPNIGFRCWNNNTEIVGTLPITGVIERKLNYELLKNNKLNS